MTPQRFDGTDYPDFQLGIYIDFTNFAVPAGARRFMQVTEVQMTSIGHSAPVMEQQSFAILDIISVENYQNGGVADRIGWTSPSTDMCFVNIEARSTQGFDLAAVAEEALPQEETNDIAPLDEGLGLIHIMRPDRGQSRTSYTYYRRCNCDALEIDDVVNTIGTTGVNIYEALSYTGVGEWLYAE